MKITKENLFIVFKVEKQVPQTVLEKFNLTMLNESLVKGTISQEENICEYINQVTPYLAEEDAGIMLLKTCFIEMLDEIEASDYFNSLFSPQFKMEEYALSNVNFYSDMDGNTYSIDMDYDFEKKIKMRIAIFIDENDDYHKVFEDFKVIMKSILGEESKNVCSE